MYRRNAELLSFNIAHNSGNTTSCCHPRLAELRVFSWEIDHKRPADSLIHRLADVFDLLESVPADQNPRISVFASEEREVPELDLKEANNTSKSFETKTNKIETIFEKRPRRVRVSILPTCFRSQ